VAPLSVNDPRHGTTNAYSNHGCRCARCRAAATEQHREWMHRTGRTTPMEVWAQEREKRYPVLHGMESGYNRGCRCEKCKRASAEARRLRRWQGTVYTHNQSGYSNGCRCDVCLTAHREYKRALRAS
jgi:hypothetical protein